MLTFASVLLSLSIVGGGLIIGFRLFGSVMRSSGDVQQFSQAVHAAASDAALAEAASSFQPQEAGEMSLVAILQRRIKHLLQSPPVCFANRRGWPLDIGYLCDGKRLFKAHPAFERIHAMPGLLTGVGILCTFLGLTIGVYGLDPTDSERLTQGVRQLLGGMSMAFLTSIAGIGTALWWTWKTKSVQDHLESSCSLLSRSLWDKDFFFVPEEAEAQLLVGNARQLDMLERLPQIIFKAVAQALEKSGFTQALNSQSQDARDISVRMANGLERLQQELGKISAGFSSFQQVNQGLQALTDQLTQAQKAAAQQRVQERDQQLLLTQDTQKAIQNIQKLHLFQGEGLKALEDAAAELKNLIRQAHAAAGDLMQGHLALQKNMERLDDHWDHYRGHLEQLNGSVRLGIEQFEGHLKQSLGKAHGEIDQLLAQSLKHFAKALADFEQVIQFLARQGSGSTAKKGEQPSTDQKSGWLGRLKP